MTYDVYDFICLLHFICIYFPLHFICLLQKAEHAFKGMELLENEEKKMKINYNAH